MTMITKLTSTTILAGIFSLYSFNTNATDLFCSKSEIEIWSCTKNEKIYTICASKDLGAEEGYLQYRVVKSGKTEFTYPSKKIHPKGLFSFYLLPRGAGIFFKNQEYGYSINELLTGETYIEVDKNESSIAEIKCNNATSTLTQTSLQNYFKEIGINK